MLNSPHFTKKHGTKMTNDTDTIALTPDTAAEVHACKGFKELCAVTWYEFFIVAINVTSIIINMLHIFVLRRIAVKRRGSSQVNRYQTLIQLISVVDIFCAVANVVKVNCNLHLGLSHAPKWVGIFVLILEDCFLMYRYPLLVIACAERYFSLCHAMKPAAKTFTKYFGVWNAITFICVAGLFCARGLISMKRLCIHPVVGVMVNSQSSIIIFFLSVLVPLVLATVFMVLSSKEMKKMGNRAATTADEQFIRNSTVYVIIISISFYVCFIPAVVSVLVKMVGKIQTQYTAMTVNIVTSLYGVFNTLVYGWKHQRYRKELKHIFLKRLDQKKIGKGSSHGCINEQFVPDESKVQK